jgi:hypothetical protein
MTSGTSGTSRSWTSFHRRGDVLRAVVAAADARRDGALPMDVEGVPETFGDDLSLLGALSLRWHTRLAGRIEHELSEHPGDPEDAVLAAWRAAARELPGVRSILDRHREAPVDEAMAAAMRTSTTKEHVLLAVMAGRTGAQDPAAPRIGKLLESRARAGLGPEPHPESRPVRPGGHAADRSTASVLLERLKAVLAA